MLFYLTDIAFQVVGSFILVTFVDKVKFMRTVLYVLYSVVTFKALLLAVLGLFRKFIKSFCYTQKCKI